MMTILMDSTSDVSSRERVRRLYNKNVELENRHRKAAQARIPSDPNAWQQMRENYEAIVLEDHAFSEQHEIEYALWQLHYGRIEELRSHLNAALLSTGLTASLNGKVPSRPSPVSITKIRSQFKTFLSEATGFYHDLMVKIRGKHGLPLGYFSDDLENQVILSADGSKSAEVKKRLISCHRCLIYLGDLARYKGLYGEGESKTRDFAAAACYYKQASSLWPSHGNPHHQLAILASYLGDELVAAYRYFRSLAVENPFTTARDNLIIAFEKNRQSYSQMLGDSKIAIKTEPMRMTRKGRGKGEARLPLKDSREEAGQVKERSSSMSETLKAFSIRFVRLNGILFTRTSLETFGEIFSVSRSNFLELLSSGPHEEYNFGSDAAECRLMIIRMIAILIFTVHNASRETENQSYAEILQRSVLLQIAFTAIFEFMGHILERCIQLNDPSTSYLLSGIMVFLEWLACRPDIAVGSDVEEKQAIARSVFWTHCISFLNKLISTGFMSSNEDEDETCFFNMSRYDEGETTNRLALSEDFELRGFLPLLPAQLILDFSRKHSSGSDGGNKEEKARFQRIIAAGKALANLVYVGQQGIYFDTKLKRFSIGLQPQKSDSHSLCCSLEIPLLNGSMGQGYHIESQKTQGILQPMAQLYMEGEEEDEVIVFKPSVTEKYMNGIASEPTSSEDPGSDVNYSKDGLGSHDVSVSATDNCLVLQNALNTNSRPSVSLASIATQYLQPIQPSTSRQLVAQDGFMENGLTNLSLLDNGLPMNQLQGHIGVFQPAPPLRFRQSINLDADSKYPVHASETVIPSLSDSIIFSGSSVDSLPIKSSPVLPPSFRKKPVSRPVRHFGPPPGFSSVPSNLLDESLSGITLKNENQPMDDYSWLDGYHLHPSNQVIGLSDSINHSAHTDHPIRKSNSSMGKVSFPFPGKQVPSLQIQMEPWKGWQNCQIPEHLKLYQEQQQQQQLQKGNQQAVALPEQRQRQSLWEGRFFV